MVNPTQLAAWAASLSDQTLQMVLAAVTAEQVHRGTAAPQGQGGVPGPGAVPNHAPPPMPTLGPPCTVPCGNPACARLCGRQDRLGARRGHSRHYCRPCHRAGWGADE